jgi:hypothetical protein
MNLNDGWRMLLYASFLWAWEHKRALLMGAGVMVLVWLLSGCTIGPIAISPTPPATVTPWPTNTPSATYTLTAVNISPSPTDEPTPTKEVFCYVPRQATITGLARLYANHQLTEPLGVDLFDGEVVIVMQGPRGNWGFSYQVEGRDGLVGWVYKWQIEMLCE